MYSKLANVADFFQIVFLQVVHTMALQACLYALWLGNPDHRYLWKGVMAVWVVCGVARLGTRCWIRTCGRCCTTGANIVKTRHTAVMGTVSMWVPEFSTVPVPAWPAARKPRVYPYPCRTLALANSGWCWQAGVHRGLMIEVWTWSWMEISNWTE